MPWATRGRKKYFYRSVRLPDGRVGKKYLGKGLLAEEAERADIEAQIRRKVDQAEVSRTEATVEPIDALSDDLDDGLNLLAVATLMAGGLHQHKGQWRRKRGS